MHQKPLGELKRSPDLQAAVKGLERKGSTLHKLTKTTPSTEWLLVTGLNLQLYLAWLTRLLPTSTMTECPSQTSVCLSARTARLSSFERLLNGWIISTVSRSPCLRPVTRKLLSCCCDELDDPSKCWVCSKLEQSQLAPFSTYSGERRSWKINVIVTPLSTMGYMSVASVFL